MDAQIHNSGVRAIQQEEHLKWLIDMNNKFSQFTDFYDNEHNRITGGHNGRSHTFDTN